MKMQPRFMLKTITALLLLGMLCGLPVMAECQTAASSAQQDLIPRVAADKHKPMPALVATAKIARIVIKFHEGTGIRLRSGALATIAVQLPALPGDVALSSAELTQELQEVDTAAKAHGSTISALFRQDEAELKALKESGEQKSKRQLADLSLYFEMPLARGTTLRQMAALIGRLNALKSVEVAYAEPEAELAVLEAPAGGYIPAPEVTATTPDFTAEQGYLAAAPQGIDAFYAWTVPGGRGDLVKIVDVESAWRTTHEDMPPLFVMLGSQDPDVNARNHGTAVLGEVVGKDNGLGVTGIANNAQAGYSSIASQSTASAITSAAAAAGRGGMVLIELHRLGPANSSACTCNTGQCDYIALEYWLADFDAIVTATANGVIVVEAGGNGSSNLDDPAYGGAFDRSVRDSGAILVGASNGGQRSPTCWTNWGSRVDVHGWGYYVTTMGYGDRYNGGTEDIWYTGSFNGTSSASPIIVGSSASLQGMALNSKGTPLGPLTMRSLLKNTGTAQTSELARNIGPLPDLRKAADILISATKDQNIDATPTAHDFGRIPTGSLSTSQTFTISNKGIGHLTLGTVAVGGANAADFVKQADTCSGRTLLLSESCTVNVLFSPSAGGAKTASLSVPSNDPDTATFQVQLAGKALVTLTVSKTGTAGGRVTSVPAGINCGSDCTESYDLNTAVTLTATPDANAIFAGWSGGGCSGTGPCEVIMNGNVSVTATFNLAFPVADFICSPLSGYAPLTVQCTDKSAYNPTSWAWDFGDGSQTTVQNPSNLYKNPGIYSVSLKVTNSTGTDTETKLNYITVLTCPNPPARIAGPTPAYYASLQDAYNAATDGDIIQTLGTSLTGNLSANRNISVSLEGGYDCGYGVKVGATTLKGMITTSAGRLTIKDFILMK
jgi:hypothetical protein